MSERFWTIRREYLDCVAVVLLCDEFDSFNRLTICSVWSQSVSELSKVNKAENETMLTMNIMKLVLTESASSVLSAVSENGTIRFSAENRKPNEAITIYFDTLLRSDEGIDTLSNAKKFSILDANSTYCQIQINKIYRQRIDLI